MQCNKVTAKEFGCFEPRVNQDEIH